MPQQAFALRGRSSSFVPPASKIAPRCDSMRSARVCFWSEPDKYGNQEERATLAATEEGPSTMQLRRGSSQSCSHAFEHTQRGQGRCRSFRALKSCTHAVAQVHSPVYNTCSQTLSQVLDRNTLPQKSCLAVCFKNTICGRARQTPPQVCA